MDSLRNYINLFGETTQTYTPQQATHEGYVNAIKDVIATIKRIDKPTKQIQLLLAELEKKINE